MARKAALDICASCPFSPFIVVLTFIIIEKMRRGALHVGGMAEQSEQEGEEGFDAEAVYSNKNDVSGVCRMPNDH